MNESAGNANEERIVSANVDPTPPADVLGQIQALYDAGLNIQAYDLAQLYGALGKWRGSTARTLAGRLATNVGGQRLGRAIHWLSYRSDPRNADLASYHAYTLLHRRGPLATFEFLERFGLPLPNTKPDHLMHFYTVRASVAGALRDFDAAEKYFERAVKADPQNPWVATSRAHLFEQKDRYEESVEAARHALTLRPWYRPGVQALAHGLQLLDRDEEALALLTEAMQHVENMYVAQQLALLQEELQLYQEAAATLEKFAELAPLMEKMERQWLERERIGLACAGRNCAVALTGARQIKEPLYEELVKRLESGGEFRRIRLDVPFVRQHHMTCAPATLSAISRFWKKPASHLEVAEAICYDGTPAHSERNWAETNGWAVREFKVTWESAVALLNRGIPFTLTTTETTSGHLQAAVGYDELRQSLWIRDPFVYRTSEYVAKSFLERYAATGPRGMALVPQEKRNLFDGLELPEAALYDQLHAINLALNGHRRDEAWEICERMEAENPGHRLTLTARRSLAGYDSNTPVLLECIEELLKQYPENGNLNLAKLRCLHELASREQRLQLLEKISSTPGSDPVFWQQYAQELKADARQHGAAGTWIRWALRYRPTDPAFIASRADLLWSKREFEKAAVHYRIAACLGDMQESFSRSFFIASRHLRGMDAALDFLRARNDRLGGRSSGPAMTLIDALEEAGQTAEASRVLDAALARRLQDGPLRLFASDFHARFSRFEVAEKLLQEARGQCAVPAWHRAAAALANYQIHKQDALSHWREVLNLEPLAHDAIRATTWLLAETEGRPAALQFLDELSQRFPYSCPLLAFRIEWLKEDGAAVAIPQIRRLLEVNPATSWGWRELALTLAQSGDSAGALNAAQEAIRLEPDRSPGFCVRAHVYLRNQQVTEARKDLREALRLEVDNDAALSQFVNTAPTIGERREALVTVQEELRRQVIFRDALFTYQEAARGLLPSQEVLDLLREAHRARPNLWQAWSVLVNQLVDMGDYVESLTLAQEAVQRFPLVHDLYIDLARVEKAKLNLKGEIEALEKVLQLNARHAQAARELAGIHERQGDLTAARKVLEAANHASPLDAAVLGGLADVLWEMGEQDSAIERMQKALRLQPGYDWGWRMLGEWSRKSGKPELAAEMARDLVRTRAGEARSWLFLAKALTPERPDPSLADSATEEIFSALDKAVELNPRCEEAYDWRAWLLSQLNRFDEALEQCSPAAFQSPPPQLQIRAAWINAQRGNVSQAIIIAKKAVTQHPDHYGGWQMLSDWYWQTKQADLAIQAAEKMAALSPLNPIPLGYLGDLKKKRGDNAGAKVAFARAFTLNPEYEYAGFQLFHQQCSDKELSAAWITLEKLERKGRKNETLACRVEFFVAKKDWGAAREAFEALCDSKDLEKWPINHAITKLSNAGQKKSVDDVLEKHVTAAKGSPAVAECWVERKVARGQWNLHKKLNGLKAEGEIGRRAVLVYLDALGDAFTAAKRKKDVTTPLQLRYHFWRLLKRHRSWLEKDVDGWGHVGYVLTNIGRPGPVIAWLGDWKSRPQAKSWMLYNLVLMLHRKERYEESREIIRHAVTLRHNGDLYGIFRIWAAFEEALSGNVSVARQHLVGFPTEAVHESYRALFPMIRLLVELQDQNYTKKPGFDEVREQLKSAFKKGRPYQSILYVRDAYRRLLKVAAPTAGGFRLRAWGAWNYRRSDWTKLVLMALLVPVGVAFPPLIIPLIIYWVRNNRRE